MKFVKELTMGDVRINLNLMFNAVLLKILLPSESDFIGEELVIFYSIII